MLELAAKLALLRKDSQADLHLVNVKNQYAIVALSLSNISHDHPIWDVVLSSETIETTHHNELLESIATLFQRDRELVNDEAMSSVLRVTPTLSKLNLISTHATVFNTNASITSKTEPSKHGL